MRLVGRCYTGQGHHFKMGFTFAVLRMLGNIDALKEILANSEIGLLSSFLNSYLECLQDQMLSLHLVN